MAWRSIFDGPHTSSRLRRRGLAGFAGSSGEGTTSKFWQIAFWSFRANKDEAWEDSISPRRS